MLVQNKSILMFPIVFGRKIHGLAGDFIYLYISSTQFSSSEAQWIIILIEAS
jgi:hypothetical protein